MCFPTFFVCFSVILFARLCSIVFTPCVFQSLSPPLYLSVCLICLPYFSPVILVFFMFLVFPSMFPVLLRFVPCLVFALLFSCLHFGSSPFCQTVTLCGWDMLSCGCSMLICSQTSELSCRAKVLKGIQPESKLFSPCNLIVHLIIHKWMSLFVIGGTWWNV